MRISFSNFLKFIVFLTYLHPMGRYIPDDFSDDFSDDFIEEVSEYKGTKR